MLRKRKRILLDNTNTLVPFSPIQLSGLIAWYKADEGVTLNGSNVSQQDDLSGNGNHRSQVVAASQPLLVSNVLNGKPSIQYDGVDDHLICNANLIGNSGDKTIISVFQINNFQYGGLVTSRLGDDCPSIITEPGQPLKINLSNPSATSAFPSILVSNFYSLLAARTGTTNTFFINNLTSPSPPDSTTIGTPSTSTYFGTYRCSAANFISADECEHLIFNRGLTLPEINLMLGYLKTRYALW